MESPVSVDPFRCRVWSMHDRLEEHITEENCANEIQSFKEHGQLIPVLGRPVADDPDYDIELICGARRLFVARYLRASLLVEVREMSDREAIIAMDLENRHRSDISPYERGVSYAGWLRSGHFESQEEIAHALGVSPSNVSRLLKLARLPSVVVSAFESATDIRENWGLHLAELLEDSRRREPLIRAARETLEMSPRPCAREVYRRLLASLGDSCKVKSTSRDKVVKGKDGAPVFRVRYQRQSVALLLPLERTSSKSLAVIEQAVLNILQEPSRDSFEYQRAVERVGPRYDKAKLVETARPLVSDGSGRVNGD